MIKLRDYQEKGINEIRDGFHTGYRKILACAPPGGGKGTIMASIIHDSVQRGSRSLTFAHKRELIYQLADRYQEQFGINDIGFIMNGEKQKERQVMLGSTQSLKPRIEKGLVAKFPLVLMDECHRWANVTSSSVLEHLKESFLIGFTATPFRTDKKPFSSQFEKIIQMTTYSELVKKKSLVPTRVKAPECPNLDGVRTSMGDYDKKELFVAYDEERIYKAIVDKWLEYAYDQNLEEYRKTIVFCVNSTLHLHKTCQYFRDKGIDAHYISDKKIVPKADGTYEEEKMSKGERAKLYKDFEEGKFKVLLNINLFTEGISIDDVSCIVFNVATKSLNKYVQAGARGSRPLWNSDYSDWRKNLNGTYQKEDCLIIDFGENCERHGYIDHYDLEGFSLEGKVKKKGENPVKVCMSCSEINPVQAKKCRACGEVFPVQAKDKAFADELEWREIRPEDAAMKRLSKLPFDTAYHAFPHSLRLIGLAKGWAEGWALRTAAKRGLVPITNPLNPTRAEFRELKAYLVREEKGKGLAGLYDKLKGKYETI